MLQFCVLWVGPQSGLSGSWWHSHAITHLSFSACGTKSAPDQRLPAHRQVHVQPPQTGRGGPLQARGLCVVVLVLDKGLP